MDFNLAKFKECAEGFKVLYVESDDDLREQMHKVLARFFTQIDVLANGQEAYESFLENKQDIIITDIVLADLNGVEILKKIKLKGYSPIVVVHSSYTDVEHMIDLIHLHIDYFVIKPFNNKQFLIKLYELVVARFEKNNIMNGSDNSSIVLSELQEIANIYDNIEQGIVVIEGNSIVRANHAFLNLSRFDDYETLKLEMPHIGTLFVACPRSLDALDNQGFVQQLIESDPAESTVYIAKDGDYREYMISCVELEDLGQYIISFTDISDVVRKYKKDVVTSLPNKFSIQRKLKLFNMEYPEFNALLISIKHFDVFRNYYGKRIANDLERFFVKFIEKILSQFSDSEVKPYYFAHYEQNKYLIIGTEDLEHLIKPILAMHLNEFTISGHEDSEKEKKTIDIGPMHTLKKYTSQKDSELVEINIINDFDKLNYTLATT